MNLQTTKARARWIGWCWIVTHPQTSMSILACRPHDSAALLLKEHVLPRMVGGADR